ncbi:hypothetical protein [Parasitella parasitica]|uniref:BZIP domain-containing protein n=1 Tax=Parasitella parasitica TaxID=35722 RepID=A0A0B7NL14_9FUNG|nr:hypothetical protein [Parasitella parasitica]
MGAHLSYQQFYIKRHFAVMVEKKTLYPGPKMVLLLAQVVFHQEDSTQSEDDCRPSPNISNEVEKALDQPHLPKSPPSLQSIKLNSKGAIQLTSSSNCPSPNATTNAILNLKINPFFHDKRKWDESFTVAEKKELTGNIVKAAKDNDGETYVTLQEEEYTIPISNLDDEDDSQESDNVDNSNKKPGRKPMADEDSLSDPDQDPKVKRKAQNRAAQRAFRERKERYVKELEIKIKQVQDAHLVATAHLIRENQQLRAIIYRLESENNALKGIPMHPYQSQAPPPVHQAVPRTTTNHSGSSYANIAPLLPHTPNQQSLLLPGYLPNSPAPISSILHPTSPSVNQMMMLASSPLQQYPMSPVVSAAIQSISPTPSAKTISKKVPSKQHKSTPPPPPNNQPLEYTFSISTPASLRPNGGSSASSSSKHNRSEPVELVQLYPPGGSHQSSSNAKSSSSLKKSDLIMLSPGHNQSSSNNKTPKKAASVTSVSSSGSHSNAVPLTSVTTPSSLANGYHDDTSSIMSDKTSSTVNTQQQRKKIQQLEMDMLDCHIDTEGKIFCEKLHNEVCNDAFDRLLSEPLFDQMGKLNLSISSYPVPIVTGPMSFEEQQTKKAKDKEEAQDGKTEKTAVEEEKDADEANVPSEAPLSSSSPPTQPSAISPSVAAETTETSLEQNQNRLLTCPEIWFVLNQHEKFNNFTTDQLCQAVKELAKCADSGPVLEESDLVSILAKMDQGYL